MHASEASVIPRPLLIIFRHQVSNRLRSLSTRRTSLLTYAPLLIAFGYVCVVAITGAEMEARIRGLRYWALLGMAVFAIAAPHVLLPDRDLRLMQRLNRPPEKLLRHQLEPWQPVTLLFMVPTLLLAYWDPGHFGDNLGAKSIHLVSTVLLLLGVSLYSFLCYTRIGPVSQSWQEGSRGDWYRTMKENSPGGFAVPEGMVPAMLATQKVFAFGIVTLVASAYLGQSIHSSLELLPGMALVAWTMYSMRSGARHHDRAYYATNAFYGEVFRSAGGTRTSAREALPFRSVYWSPRRFRPHLWALLNQFDRKLPLGRLMAVAHALLWVLFYIDASSATVTAYLILLVVTKNAASHVLTRPDLAPLPFHLGRQPILGWVVTRFFVNLRWTMPLLGSLLIVALFDPALSYAHAVGWTLVDTVVGLATAFLFTIRTEYRYRHRLA